MNPSLAVQTLPLVAWLLALAELVSALWLLALNALHTLNRHVSALVLLLATNTFALGQLVQAADVTQAAVPTYLLAATSAVVQPFLVLVTVVLLKPDWLSPRGQAGWHRARRWLWGLAYLVALAPALLTATDVLLNRHLWYTGLNATAYSGGYVPITDFTAGSISLPVRVSAIYVAPAIALILMLYVALRDRKATGRARWVAWLLVITQIGVAVLQFGSGRHIPQALSILVANALLAAVFTFAGHQRVRPGISIRKGRLQPRLIALILVISLPVLVAAITFGLDMAQDMAVTYAQEGLQAMGDSMINGASTWLAANERGLERLVSLPGIISMDPALQEPILEAAAAAQPQLYLISTTDLNGVNLARSDGADPQDYSDLTWFQRVKDGAPVAFQTVVDQTRGEPALVISVPIKEPHDEIVGVAMWATTLAELTQLVNVDGLGETGLAYIVNSDNTMIAHPDPEVANSDVLVDLSESPPIAALRAGNAGSLSFTEHGRRWQAYVGETENGWGVVVQQPEAVLSAGLAQLRRAAATLMVSGAIALVALTWLAVGQALRPIQSLAEAASSISAGDLTRLVPIESGDEIGTLARAVNNMTDQLRGLITDLEEHVSARTVELERGTRYLETAARVARESTAVLEPRQLLERVAILISEQLGFYHTGIFLLDDSREWAVLQATSSEGGRRMLAEGHQLRVGSVGIVGHVTAHGEARVARDIGEDAVSFDNSDLPETRSELALPLQVRDEVIGALDMQSTEAAAFTDQDMEVLQILADQVALAISNARLLHQTQTALEAKRRAHGELRREAWEHRFQMDTGLTYFCDEHGVRLVEGPVRKTAAAGLPELTVPVSLGDQTLGSIQVHRDDADQWTPEEISLLRTLADQLGLALENARLFDDSQRGAARERLISEATSRLRGSLDIDTVLQAAVREIGDAFGLAEVQIRIKGTSGRDKVSI
jgi:GAF domain-containing protein/HAMP domain-containing protein